MLKTIKTKIIATYSLVMIAFISTLLLVTFFNERSRILELALEKSTEISHMHAELLNKEFSQYIAMLKVLSDNPEVKSGHVEQIQPQLKRLMEIGNGDFINAIYVDKNLTVTDADGKTIKATHATFLNNQQWHDQEHNITTPVLSKIEEEPVIFVAVRILDADQQWAGTIAVAVPVEVIDKKLSAIEISKGSYAWIADSENVVVSHPNKQFVMVKITSLVENNFAGLLPIIEKTTLQDSGYGQYFDKNMQESKIVTFSKIHNLPSWNFFVTTQESEVFRDIYEVLYNVLITSFILMVIFLVIIIKLSGKITKPLIQLTKDVKASVDNKHADFKVIHSNDEIGLLYKAFCETTQKINQHTHYLEEMVNDRTKEISTKNLILSKQNNKLARIASTDPLTNLYNRRAFNALVDKEMLRARDHNTTATLVVLDIDHFKKINDQFGHDMGDHILCRLADELSAHQERHFICRWGGEEFVILLPNTSQDDARIYMEDLREKISKTDFDPVGQLTFSAGAAMMTPEEPFKAWFQKADKALFNAKTSGRNRIVWHKEKDFA